MDGKQLRNSILQWAIQGKLVPQDPNDEPASVLLERIREEKARLVKEKKIKRDKNESIIFRGEDNSYYEKFLVTGEVKCIDDEIPFEMPASWQWERWGNLSHSIQYGYNAPAEEAGDIRMVRISDIQNGDVLWATVPYCHISANEIETYLLQKDDILFARTGGTVGKSFLVRDVPYPSIYAGYLIRTRYSHYLSSQYMKYFMESQLYWEQLRNGTIATAQPNCNGKTLAKMILPIPPFNEQVRITEKLNHVLELVEKYGKSQDKLNDLNTHINELLKKSILQDAVQGKLVPQNSSDEPASVLLEKIKAEKERLIKEKKIKRDKQDSIIYRGDDNKYYEKLNGEVIDITDQIPFDIPLSWQWVRMKKLCSISTGASFKKEEASIQGENRIRILRGGNILPFRLLLKDDDIFIDKSIVNENILLRGNDLVTPAVTSLENICKMARVEQDYDNITMGGFVFIIRGYKNDRILSHYLQCVFSSPTTIEFVRSITNKSGQAFYNIGKERLSNTLIPIPPYDEMERITSQIDVIFQSLN